MIEVAVLSPRTGVALAACCSLILLRKKNPKTQLQKTTKTWHTKQQFFRTQMPPSLFRLCFYRYREGGERERESSGNKQIDPGAFLFGGRCPRLKKKTRLRGGLLFFFLSGSKKEGGRNFAAVFLFCFPQGGRSFPVLVSRELRLSPFWKGRGSRVEKEKKTKKWVFRVEFFKGERMRESEKKKANRGKRGERRICAAPHTRVISRLDANSSPPDLRGKEKMERRRERVFFLPLVESEKCSSLTISAVSTSLEKKEKHLLSVPLFLFRNHAALL